MKEIIAKTFGGLSTQYYIRQFIFGLIFPILYYFMLTQKGAPSAPNTVIGLFFVNTILYPYSRFVYESTIDYIMGGNVFFVNAFIMLFVKFITMSICWGFSILISPIGLIYLYFHHSKKTN